eukprot:8420081-Lingulodinium_polyedra.AAC.1
MTKAASASTRPRCPVARAEELHTHSHKRSRVSNGRMPRGAALSTTHAASVPSQSRKTGAR